LKTALRRLAPRTPTDVKTTTTALWDTITPADARAFYRHARYYI
jgi:hypothetical protein